jgi:hypothetical protein
MLEEIEKKLEEIYAQGTEMEGKNKRALKSAYHLKFKRLGHAELHSSAVGNSRPAGSENELFSIKVPPSNTKTYLPLRRLQRFSVCIAFHSFL